MGFSRCEVSVWILAAVKCLCVCASLVSADHLCFRPASSTDKAAPPFLQCCHAQRHHEQHTRFAPGPPPPPLPLSLPYAYRYPTACPPSTPFLSCHITACVDASPCVTSCVESSQSGEWLFTGISGKIIDRYVMQDYWQVCHARLLMGMSCMVIDRYIMQDYWQVCCMITHRYIIIDRYVVHSLPMLSNCNIVLTMSSAPMRSVASTSHHLMGCCTAPAAHAFSRGARLSEWTGAVTLISLSLRGKLLQVTTVELVLQGKG